MKVFDLRIMSVILLMSFVITTSCNSQTNTVTKTKQQSETKDAQIAEYVFEIFKDSKGNLWFGTNEGAAKYDGEARTYFTTKDGLSGNIVTSFVEDKEGNIWFGTHSGLSKYNGKTFTGFTDKNGLVNNTVSELLIDKKGTLGLEPGMAFPNSMEELFQPLHFQLLTLNYCLINQQ